jgi:mycothiol synthase
MQGGVVFRSPRMDEAEAVAAVLNAHSLADIGAEDTLPEVVRANWERPGTDRDRDLIVAVDAGEIVGYLEVDAAPPWTTIRMDGYVRPDRWGRGVGSALLRRGEHRARTLAERAEANESVSLFHGAWHATPAAQLLERHGFELARVFLRMRIDMDEPPPPPELPDGMAIRRIEAGREERAVHEAMEEAFADHWNHRPTPFDRWLHDAKTRPGYDPALWFVATEGDEIAGATVALRSTAEESDSGWLDDVSVRRPWRRRGVALAMLRHAFRELYRMGIRKAALTVDAESPTGATALYEKAGMRLYRQIDVYRKDITPGA